MRKDLIRVKKKANPQPRPTVVINVVVIKRFARRVFGFEKANPNKYLKSSELDPAKVSIQLAKIEADMAWIKKFVWLMICGGALGFYFS